MAFIAVHLNAGVILMVTVKRQVFKSPSSPTSIPLPPTPISPSLISLVVSVDVKHHIYLPTEPVLKIVFTPHKGKNPNVVCSVVQLHPSYRLSVHPTAIITLIFSGLCKLTALYSILRHFQRSLRNISKVTCTRK